MAAKKRTYQPKMFESTQTSKDTSANIYLSMLTSSAWKDLSNNSRVVYLDMKSQYYGQKKVKEPDENGNIKEFDQECFYFNWGIARDVFGIKNPTQLNKDIKSLIEHGFVEIVKNGKNTRTKSVYKLSDKWQKWNV